MDTKMYKKRPGTSGIKGYLYETKLLSLLLFRAIHDEDIEEFYLGSNVDNIGAFDDICFKAKIKGFDRPIALFIQIKHRVNNKTFSLENTNDLTKYFDSYRKIRNSFTLDNNDVMFKGSFDETECFFILYTNANAENTKKFEGSFSDKLHDLIGSEDDNACTIEFKEKYSDILIQSLITDQIQVKTKKLAEHLAQFICGECNFANMFDDEIIVHYHHILVEEVFLTSEIQTEGYRYATFNYDFFETRQEFNMFLKRDLSIEIVKRRQFKENDVENLLVNLLDESSDIRYEALLKLTESVLTFKEGKLKFVVEINEYLNNLLNKIDVSQLNIDQAMESAAKRILGELHFKVPAAFGHKDLYLRGNGKKVEKRLKHLEKKIAELLLKSEPDKIVTIDDTIEDGLLRLNGGLSGAVGSLLVLDKETNLLKFTDSSDTLGDNAIILLTRLKLQNENLSNYRFDIKTKRFPKLSFDSETGREENMVRDFFHKLLFYPKQAEVDDVGIVLKQEIEEKEQNSVTNIRIKSDTVAIAYHDEIQKWWMKSKEAPYFSKGNNIYKDVMNSIIDEPLTSAVNTIYKNKLKGISWSFSENAIHSLGLEVYPVLDHGDTGDRIELKCFLPMTAIITEMIVFTVMKVCQHFENKEVIVLDLEYILNLYPEDFNSIITELKNTNDNKTLLIVYDSIQKNRNWGKRFEKFAKVMDEKNINVIIITNEETFDSTKKYFSQIYRVIKDEKNNLVDFSEESQLIILENCRILFQGQEISLNALIDVESKDLIKVDILDKIWRNDGTIVISQPLNTSKYDKVKEFYIDRRVAITLKNNVQFVKTEQSITNGNVKYVKTFYDLERDIVVLTATPGMGKSTLLTHLSIQTKKVDPAVWIVRIDLLENTETFSKWQEDRTVINTLEALEFLCKHVIKSDNKEENDVKIILEQCYDEVLLRECTEDDFSVFQLKLFLHFYNRRRIIFLFDGFDEISPHYITEVLSLLKIVANNLRQHRMWITSRSYNDLTAILEREFGESVTLACFSGMEQILYLNKLWCKKLVIQHFNEIQIRNVRNFVNFMERMFEQLKTGKHLMKLPNLPLLEVYLGALKYLFRNRPICLKLEYTFSIPGIICENPFKNLFFNAEHDLTLKYRFFSTPLHLYVTADYFLRQIEDVRNTNNWDLDTNTFTMYERLLETKLMKIRFSDKNAMILSKPDVKMTFDKERAEFTAMHKKLAVYTIFHEYKHEFFDSTELEDIQIMIIKLKQGFEKTGLIYKIVNNIPMFVHMTIAEHFAVEHICDTLKNDKAVNKIKSTWNFILNVMFFQKSVNILNIMDHKLKYDDDLRREVEKYKPYIFDLLIAQGSVTGPDFKIRSSLARAVSENWGNFISLLMSSLETHVNKHNLNKLINIFNDTNMLKYLQTYKFYELEMRIRDLVRNIDEARLKCLNTNVSPECTLERFICLGDPTGPDPVVHAFAKSLRFDDNKIFDRLRHPVSSKDPRGIYQKAPVKEKTIQG